MARRTLDRRNFLASGLVLAGCRGRTGPVVAKKAEAPAPKLPFGVQVGDVSLDRAVVWSRADRVAQMRVEWWREGDARRVVEAGPTVGPESDFTGVLELSGLPPGARIEYAVSFAAESESERVTGSFRTPGAGDVTFAWSGDTCGQGWGIDLDRGGLRVYDTIRKQSPDFFLHSGDMIYADVPIPAERTLQDGTKWRNVVTPAKSKPAETLDDFRGNFQYHLLDEHVRRFHREVPLIVQWDDHEVHNNWWPGQVLDDPRYSEKHASKLAHRARQALFEYTPIRRHPMRAIHRVVSRGPLVDVFVLDARSFRGPNGPNLEPDSSDVSAYFGATQLGWLFDALAASRATWKVLACDQPLGLVIHDAPSGFEGMANGDPGAPKGRELELSRLLRFLEAKRLSNFVLLTADVHYVAAHHYAPERAKIGPFPSFHEFVVGPLHAGGFGPEALDPTFGGEVRFQRVPPVMDQPPIGPWPSFGTVHVDAATHVMTVRLHDGEGAVLHETKLTPS